MYDKHAGEFTADGASGEFLGPVLVEGTAVQVRNRFLGGWSTGFEVVAVDGSGYLLRRVSDRQTLPERFPFDQVRQHRLGSSDRGATMPTHHLHALDPLWVVDEATRPEGHLRHFDPLEVVVAHEELPRRPVVRPTLEPLGAKGPLRVVKTEPESQESHARNGNCRHKTGAAAARAPVGLWRSPDERAPWPLFIEARLRP